MPELYCPECMNPLTSVDGVHAVCAAHNATYRILFRKWPVAAPAAVLHAGAPSRPFGVPPPPPPPPLPQSSAATVAQPGVGMQHDPYPLSPVDEQARRLTSAFGAPPPMTVPCAKHPAVTAVARCHSCTIAICATCDFVSPGGFHLCPACALNPNPRVSSKRKKMVWWSVGLAVLAVATFSASMTMIFANPRDKATLEGANIFLMLGFFIAVVGLGLGLAARDRRFKTPVAAWIGIVGNGAIVAIFLLLSLVGSLKG